MPVRKSSLRRKRDTNDLTADHVEHLFRGFVCIPANYSRCADIHRAYHGTDDARAAWNRHKALVMRWWFIGVPVDAPELSGRWKDCIGKPAAPFSRPWAWWKFDAPEPRRIVKVGDLDRSSGEFIVEVQKIWDGAGSDTSYGRPCYTGLFKCEDDDVYMRRLPHLLTPDERKL